MEYANQAQTGPAQGNAQTAQPGTEGLYRYQPGVGFVPVQGAAPETGTAGNESAQAAGARSDEAAASQSGMFGQGIPEGTQPKFDQNKFGQMYGMVSDIMNGEADPASLLGLFAGSGGEFWKGALVGAAAVVLLNNDKVKGALSGLAASGASLFREADPEGAQVTVGKD